MSAKICDIHVHFGAPGIWDQDPYYWSEAFTKTGAYLAFRLITGTVLARLDFAKCRKKIVRVASRAKKAGPFVLLALDKAYDDGGTARQEWTHLYVANSVVIDLTRAYPDLFRIGASVHPFNPRWREELRACVVAGAVLCKWIPSAQRIDPSDVRLGPFYDELAAHNLPLLCHAGPELSIPPAEPFLQCVNRPGLLEGALRRKVPVIIAHAALPFEKPFGYGTELDDYPPYLELVDLVRRAPAEGWKIFIDLSALLFARGGYLGRVLDDIPSRHLLLGSDYPIPISDLAPGRRLTPWAWIKRLVRTMTRGNLLDWNLALLEEAGFDIAACRENAENLFAAIRR